MKASLEIKGIQEYMETLANLGQDVDRAAQQVLSAAAPEAFDKLHFNLRRTSEEWTGAAEATLYMTPVQKDGNVLSFELGADTARDPAARYKEFGRAAQAPEPFLRPTLGWVRRQQIPRMLKQILQKAGLG